MKANILRQQRMIWFGSTIGWVLLFLVSCARTALAQSNTFPATGNVGVGTTRPNEKLTVVGNGAFGNIAGHTQLYSGFDTQSPSILEVGYGTATSSITPFSALVLSKNATDISEYIGSIFWGLRLEL